MAKKKMTKAQAAAARKEKTRSEELRDRSRQQGKEIRAKQGEVQKQANRSGGWRMVLIAIVVILAVVFALVFTIAPGMLMGR